MSVTGRPLDGAPGVYTFFTSTCTVFFTRMSLDYCLHSPITACATLALLPAWLHCYLPLQLFLERPNMNTQVSYALRRDRQSGGGSDRHSGVGGHSRVNRHSEGVEGRGAMR